MTENKYQKKFLVKHPWIVLITIISAFSFLSWIYIKGYEPEGFLLRIFWPLLPYVIPIGWIMLIIRLYVLIKDPKRFKKEVIRAYKEKEK